MGKSVEGERIREIAFATILPPVKTNEYLEENLVKWALICKATKEFVKLNFDMKNFHLREQFVKLTNNFSTRN